MVGDLYISVDNEKQSEEREYVIQGEDPYFGLAADDGWCLSVESASEIR